MTVGPRTLFGSRDNTLSGSGKEREQTVFTPPEIIAVVRQLFGGTIQYDPCHGHPGTVLTAFGREALAAKRLPADDESRVLHGLAVRVESCVGAVKSTDSRGLIDPWPNRTFVNSEYKTLKAWLEYSLTQRTWHVMLVPVRPHRKWWREWARQCSEIVYLNPVKFVGHYQSFPAPVCLAEIVPTRYPRPDLSKLCKAAGLGEAL